MHVNGVDGGKERSLLAETVTRPGSLTLLFSGSEGGNHDWKIADTECNAVFDGTWVTTTNVRIWKKKKKASGREGDKHAR